MVLKSLSGQTFPNDRVQSDILDPDSQQIRALSRQPISTVFHNNNYICFDGFSMTCYESPPQPHPIQKLCLHPKQVCWALTPAHGPGATESLPSVGGLVELFCDVVEATRKKTGTIVTEKRKGKWITVIGDGQKSDKGWWITSSQ